jgi:hypothetical protein
MILCDGLRLERRVAVVRPMPEEPPVMRMVFGVVFREVKSEAEGWNSDMVMKRAPDSIRQSSRNMECCNEAGCNKLGIEEVNVRKPRRETAQLCKLG